MSPWLRSLACSWLLVACGSEARPDTGPTGDDATMDATADVAPPPDAAPPADAAAMDSATSTLEVDEYFVGFFDTLCAWFVRCEPKIGAVAFGETTCHPLRRDAIEADFIAAVAAGTADFDADIASECLSGLAAAECNVASVDLARCDAAFVGRSLAGEPCATALDCREGVCAIGASCPGSCEVLSEGDACERPSQCALGLTCRAGSCDAAAGAGEACARRTDCAFPMTCGLSGTCQEPPGSGEACSTSLGGDLCGQDDVCRDGACAVGAAAGEACSGTSPCAPGGRCVEGACVATAVAGEACETGGCIALHLCVGAVCVALPSPGGACSAELPCVQGGCRDGVCVLLPEGETCDPNVQFGECAGFCQSSTCRAALTEGEVCRGSSQCAGGLSCRETGGRARCTAECT